MHHLVHSGGEDLGKNLKNDQIMENEMENWVKIWEKILKMIK
jgi:hypothetical protein